MHVLGERAHQIRAIQPVDPMILREATEDDIDGILAIFNQVIATSTAVWIRALLETLIARAAEMGKHAMIGGIDGENTASLAFHARFGFREVGRLPQVGAKFGRWIDLVFVQRTIGEADRPPT